MDGDDHDHDQAGDPAELTPAEKGLAIATIVACAVLIGIAADTLRPRRRADPEAASGPHDRDP